MWRKLKTWWRAEGDLAQLQGLDNRLLADMGLERDHLRERVHGRLDPAPVLRDCSRHPLRRPAAAE